MELSCDLLPQNESKLGIAQNWIVCFSVLWSKRTFQQYNYSGCTLKYVKYLTVTLFNNFHLLNLDFFSHITTMYVMSNSFRINRSHMPIVYFFRHFEFHTDISDILVFVYVNDIFQAGFWHCEHVSYSLLWCILCSCVLHSMHIFLLFPFEEKGENKKFWNRFRIFETFGCPTPLYHVLRTKWSQIVLTYM